MLSVYLRHSEGLSPENLLLLDVLAEIVDTLQGPWIIAGDFNLEPEVLKASGWPLMIGGEVLAPREATCHENVYDFFVVAKALVPHVASVTKLDYDGFSPHYPVRLLIRGDARSMCVRRLVRPTKVSAVLPHGPQIDPCKLPRLPTEREFCAGLDVAAQACRARMDAEFCGLGVQRGRNGARAKFTWMCPLEFADPEPGADRYVVLWRRLARKADLAARLIAKGAMTGEQRIDNLLAKGKATVRWATSKPCYEAEADALRCWIAALELAVHACDATAVMTVAGQAARKITFVANAMRAARNKMWRAFMRGEPGKAGHGYRPSRRAYQYIRGPAGWTAAPVAALDQEDQVPEYELDQHDELLVRAADLYQLHSQEVSGRTDNMDQQRLQQLQPRGSEPTVLSMQALRRTSGLRNGQSSSTTTANFR